MHNDIIKSLQNGERSVPILLVNSPLDAYAENEEPRYDVLFPFGLIALSRIAKDLGIGCSILDAEALRLSVRETARIITELNPAVLGFNILSPTVNIVRDIVMLLPERIFIVAGGPHPTLEPEDCLRRIPGIRLLFQGESERTWSEFLAGYRAAPREMGEASGKIVAMKSRDRIIPTVDRSRMPFPAFSTEGRKETSIMASRGCAFDCHYCSGRTLSGGRIRFRPVTNLVDEIQECQRQYGITSFHFADDNFLQNPGYVRSFRQELGNRGLSISWRSFARADSIRPEIMEDVAASGCYRLTLGLESGTDTILLRMNKRHTVEQSSAALSLCREYGIETKAFFMLGYPEETPAEIQATIDFAAASSLSHAYFYLVRSFPGTRLERELLEAGIPKADLLEYIHWVPDMDSGLTVFERACRKALEVHGVFDADSVLKYNVAHRRSINRNCSNEQLMDFMVNGYKKFYFRPSYLERFPWWADVTNEKTLEQQEVGI